MEVVIYNKELYQVFYAYSSGYIELKKIDSVIDDIILVHRSEISQLEHNAS
ncbi:hypothetical protein JOC75_000143 [Metabacillus crassostreae]|uniref:hypothetical protein n=1 Tax=Metabacillus TaxID=2675233 RepID=UPI00131579D9|nr:MULTISPECIES: hypothetical protein [Metabacillus]MBM7602173.1 hypothetical protein [Metabacillus crassostreae]